MPALLQHTATLSVRAGHETTCRGLARRVLRIRDGAAWVTQHHDVRDYILAPGDEVRIANDGPVIVHGLADVLIEVRRPVPARRLGRVLGSALGRLLGRARRAAPQTPSATR